MPPCIYTTETMADSMQNRRKFMRHIMQAHRHKKKRESIDKPLDLWYDGVG